MYLCIFKNKHMSLQTVLSPKIKEAITSLFKVELPNVEFQATRKEFEGDITFVVFPLLKLVKGNPIQLGSQIGDFLVNEVPFIEKYNVVSGFLNLVVNQDYYLNAFKEIHTTNKYGFVSATQDAPTVMVEYSSPNTNKPLHLGHIRNNLLGYAVAEILKAAGNKVVKTQIVNDRGIHICKSMLAWQEQGNGETPETSRLKGDHLVGKFYVAFDKKYKEEIKTLMNAGKTEDEAKKQAPSILAAQQMLLKWEAGDEEVVALWKKMNQWVYDGFAKTYANLGVDFDSYYYESNTYLLGKKVVDDGLAKGVFYKKEDGSVWIDLTDEGLDEKLVLRSDGTAVYMTQDIGTAIQRVEDNPAVSGMVYTVGNEQDYHFKVLFLILKKLGFSWASNLYHLSYGMVELPSGKMKSREGTVVDADDLMQEMTTTAGKIAEDLGKLDDYSAEEKAVLYHKIGLGALKYYMLKVDPKKQMMFNPEESVDFNGNTGPFIQYTFARIQSILRKANFNFNEALPNITFDLHEKEKELLKNIMQFPATVQLAAQQFSPAIIANYTYDLVKEFNSFYQNVSILGEEDLVKKQFRVQLAQKVGLILEDAFSLLGVQMPERM
jgi:arginyl-tRNA synthetase